MGFSDIQDSLADFYDSLNEKIPYFPYIFAALLVLLLGLAAYFIFAAPAQQSVEVKVLVKNAAGAAVKGAQVTVIGLEQDLNLQTDKDGVAVFNAPIGKKIKVGAQKQGYTQGSQDVTVYKGLEISIALKQATVEDNFADVTLTFVGPDSKKLNGTEVSVKLSCSGNGFFDQDEYLVKGGELNVRPPQGCGKVLVSASAAGFKAANAQVLGSEQQIFFEGIDRPKGSIEIRIIAADTNRFADGINVKLVDSHNLPTGLEDASAFGEVNFSGVDIGQYTALISDPLANFASQGIAISVSENATARKEVKISKDIKLRAKIKAQDSANANVSGANVFLHNPDGTLAAQQTTGPEGATTFLLKDDGTYSYSASKEGYIPNSDANSFSTSTFARGSEQTFVVKIKKCTVEICGTLRGRVVDENGLPVENARVLIVNKDGFVETAYGSKVTDYNGLTSAFTNIAAGTYSVLAQKFPAEAKSAQFTLDTAKENIIVVNMVIGTGTIKVSALDLDGRPIPFARADIFTVAGLKVGTVSLDAKGEGTMTLKADKSVYAIISKEG